MNRHKILKSFSASFPTIRYYVIKFGVNQVLMVITHVPISGIICICRIIAFSGEAFVKVLLRLKRGMNEIVISATLKKMSQNGTPKHSYQPSTSETWLEQVKEHMMTETL